MIAAELLRGMRVPRAAIAVAYLLGALVAANNVYVLRDAYIAYRNASDVIKPDLGVVEIARDRITSPFVLDQDVADTAYIPVSTSAYLSAADAHGSPADDPAEIAAEREAARVAADKVLGRALGVSFAPARSAPRASGSAPRVVGPPGARARTVGSCVGVDPPGAILSLPVGGAIVHASRSGVTAALRRFAVRSFPLATVPLARRQIGVARIPPDRAAEPWKLALRSRAPVTVCGSVRQP
jgi:hypothetical protein